MLFKSITKVFKDENGEEKISREKIMVYNNQTKKWHNATPKQKRFLNSDPQIVGVKHNRYGVGVYSDTFRTVKPK